MPGTTAMTTPTTQSCCKKWPMCPPNSAAVCFMLPDGRALEVEGECPGRIAFSLQNGDYGFGYDPLFIPDEYGAPDGKHPNAEARSYAQLTPDEKDAISHRGRAMEKLEEKLPAFLK
jgi:XTP/dITP diphosphohydrolase